PAPADRACHRRAGAGDRGRSDPGRGAARGHPVVLPRPASGAGRLGRSLCDAHHTHVRRYASGVTQALATGPGPDNPPPPLPDGALRVVALGGIGEVGRNMTLFEFDGRLLIVDCGALFPEDEQPGVDLILPDFRAIEDRLGGIDGLVLAHGQEDDVGAVPSLVRLRRDLPVYGSRLTLALLEAECREHKQRPNLIPVAEGGRRTIARSS